MSTVVTENLKRSSETVARSVRGVAAAWVNFNGTGTVAIRDSQNVASLTDVGVGTYNVNLTASMADTFYSSVVAGEAGGGTGNKGPYVGTQTAFAVPITTYSSAGSFVDSSLVCAASSGDLA
jgi:hypothetical protein